MGNYNPIKEMVRTLLIDGKTRLRNLINMDYDYKEPGLGDFI